MPLQEDHDGDSGDGGARVPPVLDQTREKVGDELVDLAEYTHARLSARSECKGHRVCG